MPLPPGFEPNFGAVEMYSGTAPAPAPGAWPCPPTICAGFGRPTVDGSGAGSLKLIGMTPGLALPRLAIVTGSDDGSAGFPVPQAHAAPGALFSEILEGT